MVESHALYKMVWYLVKFVYCSFNKMKHERMKLLELPFTLQVESIGI